MKQINNYLLTKSSIKVHINLITSLTNTRLLFIATFLVSCNMFITVNYTTESVDRISVYLVKDSKILRQLKTCAQRGGILVIDM